MTQNEKDLLLKDLCARLPYGVKVICETEKSVFEIEAVTSYSCVCPKDKNYLHNIDDDEIKPCLFPLSCMTEEQRKEYDKIIYHSIELHHREYSDIVEIDLFDNLQEFYHKNHLDYRELIPMGLAIDATELNIY